MKNFGKLIALLVLAASALAQTQPPANVSTYADDTHDLPALGAHITWSPVAGATYAVYRYQWATGDCNPNAPNWKVVVNNLTGTSYDDYPTPDQYGWGGFWCYGVTATVNGVESAIASALREVAMGLKWYAWWDYMSPDCSTNLGQPSGNGTLEVQRIRNGVSENMPVGFVNNAGQPRWYGFFRLLGSDTLIVTFTLPDGKVFQFKNPFQALPNASVADNDQPYVQLYINQTDDSVCRITEWGVFQQGRNNK